MTDAQVAGIAARGRRRPVARGDVLVEAVAKAVPFFVVMSGELQVSDAAETLIVTHRPGQSRIENYLGFPAGISGLDLTGRAYAQAQKFGAQIMIAKGATGLASTWLTT